MTDCVSNQSWQLSARQLLAAYQSRELSPVDVTTEVLARIQRLDQSLSCFLSVDYDGALNAAVAAEQAWSKGEAGPLCGVPISVKDTIEVAGLPTTYGSAIFKNNHQADSEIAKRLRAAGAVIVGKTNTPEFALATEVRNALGPMGRNPWDLTRTCGGSSGGAAAAVAAGLAPIAIGTDSSGSIRQPAAYNAVFGLKPSFQRIPAVQAWRASVSRSHNGPICRTVADAALVMSVLAGAHAKDFYSRGHGPMLPIVQPLPSGPNRVGVVVGKAHTEASAVQTVVKVLESRGFELTEVPASALLPDDETSEAGRPRKTTYAGDHWAAAESIDRDFWQDGAHLLMDYAKPLYEYGRTQTVRDYRRDVRADEVFGAAVTAIVDQFDFLITPVAGVAPQLDRAGGAQFPLLSCFNHSKHPAASVPTGWQDGLPVGAQIVGRFGADEAVLSLAAAVEQEVRAFDRWPAFALE